VIRGFSLAEALVAVVLCGIVTVVLTRVLVAGQRIHRAHVEDVAMSESGRAALAILPAALRELSAGDGDILAMDSGAITFKAMGALHVLCARPDIAARAVLLDGTALYGSAAIEAPADSVFLFADGDPATRLDDAWLSAAAAGAVGGTACPGGAPSITVTLSGATDAQLAGVHEGAPLRTFRPTQFLAYRDAGGDWWLGQRLFDASSGGWSTVQPVLGPLAPGGLRLTYLDAAGNLTDSAAAVSRIVLRLASRSPHRVHRPDGAAYLVRDAAAVIALRNNPRD